MAYMKKEYRDLIERMNKKMTIPNGWYKFVKKVAEKQNFIVKSKGVCTCKNCNTEFKSNKKVNEYEKCPKCKNTYLIKRNTYGWHIFEDVVILLDKFEGKWVIRLFEIFTRYTKDEIYHSKAAEYGRIYLGKKELQFANNRAASFMGNTYINHTQDGKKWRLYGNNSYYGYGGWNDDGIIYPNNIEKLCRNTKFKYSQLWTIAKENKYIHIKELLKKKYASTEILAKMKLYKLATQPWAFNKKGSFKKRFGVDKEFYDFMVENNIDLEELEILRKYKKKDIEGIRFLKEFRKSQLDEIEKYMTLEKFINYAKNIKDFDIDLYLDYIGFLKELNIDLNNKRILFPDNLEQKHNEYAEQIAIKNNPKLCKAINKRYNQLEKNSYSNNNFFIIPAKSFSALQNESKQQHHCIRTYAEKYANGKCDIYFMRKNETPDKSLVTIEVKDGKIVQSRIKNNADPNNTQKKFLQKWEKEVLKVA